MILTPDDLRILTGYKRHAEQRKELDHLQIPYKVRRDGSLVVILGDAQGKVVGAEYEPELQS